MPTPVEIAAPRTPMDHEAIKAMMREYAGSLGFSLAYQDFETELADFPGKYAPPEGALLLATVGGEAAGAVALRRLDATTCEMKRLYVKPAFRRQRTADGDRSAARSPRTSSPSGGNVAIGVSGSTQSAAKCARRSRFIVRWDFSRFRPTT
jgi:hypothetical protein